MCSSCSPEASISEMWGQRVGTHGKFQNNSCAPDLKGSSLLLQLQEWGIQDQESVGFPDLHCGRMQIKLNILMGELKRDQGECIEKEKCKQKGRQPLTGRKTKRSMRERKVN